MGRTEIQAFLKPKDFGKFKFLGDNYRIDDLTPKERVYVSAWRHACPRPDMVIEYYGKEWEKWFKKQPGNEELNPSPEEIEQHGIEITRRRYDECDFVYGYIVEQVQKAGKKELYEALTSSKPRREGESMGVHENGRVPKSHERLMSPLSSLVGFSLPRVLIEQFGWGGDGRSWGDGKRTSERYMKGLRILDKCIEKAETPEQLLVLLAREVTKKGADADIDKVLGHMLEPGIEEEENNHMEYQKVKEALAGYAPELWMHYKLMGRPVKERNIRLDLKKAVLEARGYRGRIEFYGGIGSYPGYEGLSWRTLKFRDTDTSIRDGALATLESGKRTPVEIVRAEKVFSEVPISGESVFLHIDQKGKMSAYHFDSSRKKDSSFLFDVKQGEVFCWVALGRKTSRILEYEEPGFTESDLEIIDVADKEKWEAQIPGEFWKMIDQVKNGMLKNTVIPIVELNDL